MLEIDILRQKEKRKRKISLILSLFIPGLGQLVRRRIISGLFFFLVFFSMVWLLIDLWQFTLGLSGTFAGLLIFYCLNILDAYKGPSISTAPCERKCPAGINIPYYIALTKQAMFDDALKIIMDRMPFPSTCGRICYHPCETACTLRQKENSIAIETLKRAASDLGSYESIQITEPLKNGKTVGIIGAGPAGLSAAYFLSRKNYPVIVYEREKEPGGLLIYGIPEFRLPNNVVRKEIELIQKMGIVIRGGVQIGEDFGFYELQEKHSTLLISTGSLKSASINIPGKKLKGIHNGLDILLKINKGEKVILRGAIAVIGGGNSAFDAARSAIRCGASNVTIFYRRDKEEMPGSKEELDMALREGVKIVYKTAPVSFLGQDKVQGIEFIRTKLLKVRGGKRAKIETIEGSNFRVTTDIVLIATGQTPDFSFLPSDIRKIIVRDSGISVNPTTMETSITGLFAAGDVINKEKTVVDAVGMGQKAAQGIDWYLRGGGKISRLIEKFTEFDYPLPYSIPLGTILKGRRHKQKVLEKEKAVSSFNEVEKGYTLEEAKKEASRCMQCNRRHL
jgi:NADH-quinone oxidoreductase subunit F